MKKFFRMQFLLLVLTAIFVSGCSLFSSNPEAEEIILADMDFWVTVDYTDDAQRENLALFWDKLSEIDSSKLGDEALESQFNAGIKQMKMGWGMMRGTVDAELGNGTFKEYIDPIVEGKWKMIIAMNSELLDMTDEYGEVSDAAVQVIFWTEEYKLLDELFALDEGEFAPVFETVDGVEVVDLDDEGLFMIRSEGLYTMAFGVDRKNELIELFKNGSDREIVSEYYDNDGFLKAYVTEEMYSNLKEVMMTASDNDPELRALISDMADAMSVLGMYDITGDAVGIISATENSLEGISFDPLTEEYLAYLDAGILLEDFVFGEDLIAYAETRFMGVDLGMVMDFLSLSEGVDLFQELENSIGINQEEFENLFSGNFAFMMGNRDSVVPNFGFVLNVKEDDKDTMMILHESLDLFVDEVIAEFDASMSVDDEAMMGGVMKEKVSDDFVKISFDKTKIPVDQDFDVLTAFNIKEATKNLYLYYGFVEENYFLVVSDLDEGELLNVDGSLVSDNIRYVEAVSALGGRVDGEVVFMDLQELVAYIGEFFELAEVTGDLTGEEKKIADFVLDYFTRFDYFVSASEVRDDGIVVGRFTLKLK